MNKWYISGSEACFQITQNNLITKESQSFNADKPMKLVNAMSYIMESALLGDIIILPDRTPLFVARAAANC